MGKDRRKEEKIFEQQENALKITKSKEEIMEKYKANLPSYMEEKLNEISEKMAETEAMEGIPLLQINQLIRNKNCYGQSPKYSADELNVIFDYYRQAMAEINRFTRYIPSKENFCAFARYEYNNIQSILVWT